MGFADRDRRVRRSTKSHCPSRGRAVVRRPPGRPGLAADRRRGTFAARRAARGPRRGTRRRGACPVRRHAAVPGQGPRRRRAAVAAGAPEHRAGDRGIRPRGPAGHPGQRPGSQLPRPQPQTRNHRRPQPIRGAGGFPSRRQIGRVDAGARGRRPRPVHQPAAGSTRRGRAARAVHDVDHLPAARSRRAGARRARRRDRLRPVRRAGIRARSQDRARAGGALPRRRGSAGLAAAQQAVAGAGGGAVPACRQPARLPARRRGRGDGQLRQRASRWTDPQARRRARTAARAGLHPGRGRAGDPGDDPRRR